MSILATFIIPVVKNLQLLSEGDGETSEKDLTIQTASESRFLFQAKKNHCRFLKGETHFFTRKSRLRSNCWFINSRDNEESRKTIIFFSFLFPEFVTVNWPYHISEIRYISGILCGCSLVRRFSFVFLSLNLNLFFTISHAQCYTN